MNLKERLRKKLKKNGGFTLIEMLIVVAIIAILVIVSIPVVNSSLDDAKKQTDAANVRAAKAAAMIEYMLNDGVADDYYYKDDGTVSTIKPTSAEGYSYGQGGMADSDGGYVVVTITADGVASTKWEKYTTGS